MKIKTQSRKDILGKGAMSISAAALANLMSKGSSLDAATLEAHTPRKTHHKATAKNVIYLHMTGSPPNLDMFDYKPKLIEYNDQPCPDSAIAGKRFAFTNGVPKLMGTPRKFKQVGQAGIWMSDAIPHLHKVADDLCVINSMNTDQFNHAPAELLMHTGFAQPGRPSIGAWINYGLGSPNINLPGYVVLLSGSAQPNGGKNSYNNGFLPSVYQGVRCRSKGDPVLYVSNPEGMNSAIRRRSLDSLNELNTLQAKNFGHPETLTRIAQYELAYRMQSSVPEVMNMNDEPKHILESYGAKPGEASLANNCLLARRLIESGVRYVQIFDWGWDFHGTNPKEDIRDGLTNKCATMDKPVAALIQDLKQRGLLEETLIVWGGEFGRTPFREGRTSKGSVLGRDHYPDCYTMFMAGGGIKAGLQYGKTDELGFSITEKKVHIHDLQATILHTLGFDHTKLTFRFQGRDYRLTDVHGHVVKPLLA